MKQIIYCYIPLIIILKISKWLFQVSLLIEITAKPPVITTESSTTNVSTNGSAECDVQGATHCLSTVKPTYQPVLMMLATQNLINITAEKVQSICM